MSGPVRFTAPGKGIPNSFPGAASGRLRLSLPTTLGVRLGRDFGRGPKPHSGQLRRMGRWLCPDHPMLPEIRRRLLVIGGVPGVEPEPTARTEYRGDVSVPAGIPAPCDEPCAYVGACTGRAAGIHGVSLARGGRPSGRRAHGRDRSYVHTIRHVGVRPRWTPRPTVVTNREPFGGMAQECPAKAALA